MFSIPNEILLVSGSVGKSNVMWENIRVPLSEKDFSLKIRKMSCQFKIIFPIFMEINCTQYKEHNKY